MAQTQNLEAIREKAELSPWVRESGQGRLGVVAFEVEGVHPHDVGQVLDFEDVAIRVGHHCAIPLHRFFGVKASSRVTVALTTTAEEIEQFIEGLHKVQKYFGGASERA